MAGNERLVIRLPLGSRMKRLWLLAKDGSHDFMGPPGTNVTIKEEVGRRLA